LGNPIKKNEMGGACDTYGRQERYINRVFVGDLREGDHLEDLDVDGRIILKWIFKKWDGARTGIHLAQDRDRWHFLVKVVMNLLFP
jgi:hypothetical protein